SPLGAHSTGLSEAKGCPPATRLPFPGARLASSYSRALQISMEGTHALTSADKRTRIQLHSTEMRIYLISPTHYDHDGSLHKTTRYWTSGITLPYLKALTPTGHDVAFVDELFYDVDLGRECDVVGLTAMGPQIQRAYDLADHFRTRGCRVVLGGTWLTLTAEQSLQHADAVVAGEAEAVWPQVLADFAEGRSRGIYRAAAWHDLRNLPPIDYTTLPLLKYDAFKSSWLY